MSNYQYKCCDTNCDTKPGKLCNKPCDHGCYRPSHHHSCPIHRLIIDLHNMSVQHFLSAVVCTMILAYAINRRTTQHIPVQAIVYPSSTITPGYMQHILHPNQLGVHAFASSGPLILKDGNHTIVHTITYLKALATAHGAVQLRYVATVTHNGQPTAPHLLVQPPP